jgi:hypothetical protein
MIDHEIQDSLHKNQQTKERYLKEKLNSSKLKPQYLIIDVQIDNPQVQKKERKEFSQ